MTTNQQSNKLGNDAWYCEIGKLLCNHRLQCGLNISDISHNLKIGEGYIHAIEDGSIRSMLPDVYARGYIRSYAQQIGFDINTSNANDHCLKDPKPTHAIQYKTFSFNKKAMCTVITCSLLLCCVILNHIFHEDKITLTAHISNIPQEFAVEVSDRFHALKLLEIRRISYNELDLQHHTKSGE
jgi:cytoskeletal protein RodZ